MRGASWLEWRKVEEEGKGVDPDGNKIKAEKDKVAAFRASIRRGSSGAATSELNAAGVAGSWRMSTATTPLALPTVRTAPWLARASMSSALVILWARSGVYRRGVRRARQELSAFAKVLDAPAKPVLAILGGAKAGLLQRHGAMETFDYKGLATTFQLHSTTGQHASWSVA